MKRSILLLVLVCCTQVSAQIYEGLQRLEGVGPTVFYSVGSKDRAMSIAQNVASAESYFQKMLRVAPEYTLLVLSPDDWKKFAHPNAIYGIPHYLPDGRLVVAAQNNDFWKRNMPPLDKLPKALADEVNRTYTDKNGELTLQPFFDLLAVHELGHAFQKAAKMQGQRNWMGELLCNVLLHTFVAETNPKLLPSLTLFPKATVAAIDAKTLKYTTLEDFEKYYNEIAQKHPDNYGWFQCRFHTSAARIYDLGGLQATKNLWDALLKQDKKLDDKALVDLLVKTDAALEEVVVGW